EAELTAIVEEAQAALAGEGDTPVVFNGSPHSRGGIPAGGAASPGGQLADPVTVEERSDGGWVLENGLLRAEVDGRGLLVSVRGPGARREGGAPGAAANLLKVHPDLPNHWDAWDVDSFCRHRVTDLPQVRELTLREATAESATVRVSREFGDSRVVQWLTLRSGGRVV